MIYKITFFNALDFKRGKSVDDQELNELLQEVRSIDNRYYLHMDRFIETRYFRKPKEYIDYNLYADIDGIQVQHINIPKTREAVMSYFYGFLNGHK